MSYYNTHVVRWLPSVEISFHNNDDFHVSWKVGITENFSRLLIQSNSQ